MYFQDPSDHGWLQFTYEGSPTSQITGFGYSTKTFSLAAGIQIEFDFPSYKWTSDWALLGLTLQLFDADVSYSRGALGAFGMGHKTDGTDGGLAGGDAAVGLMDWSENNEHFCGNQQPTNTANNDYVCIRGAVLGFGNGSIGQRTNSASYPLKGFGKSDCLSVISQKSTSSPVLRPSDQWSSPVVYQNRPPAYKGQEAIDVRSFASAPLLIPSPACGSSLQTIPRLFNIEQCCTRSDCSGSEASHRIQWHCVSQRWSRNVFSRD